MSTSWYHQLGSSWVLGRGMVSGQSQYSGMESSSTWTVQRYIISHHYIIIVSSLYHHCVIITGTGGWRWHSPCGSRTDMRSRSKVRSTDYLLYRMVFIGITCCRMVVIVITRCRMVVFVITRCRMVVIGITSCSCLLYTSDAADE